MFDITNKSAIITGAAAGIGKAIAQRFHAAGARLTLIDQNPTTQLAQQLNAQSITADLAHPTQLQNAIQQAVAHHQHIDILINNAGIQPLGVTLDKHTPQLIEKTFAVNYTAPSLAIKYASPHMPDHARIINTASFVGLLAAPAASVYAASKAALIQLTRIAALELAPRHITVNAVCPGTVKTPAVTEIPHNPEIKFIQQTAPLARLAEPDEIAALYHFLASPDAAYITGQAIAIDGGLTAGMPRYDLAPPPNVTDQGWIDLPPTKPSNPVPNHTENTI